MLTPAFSTVILADAISKCYLPDEEGNINKDMPEGVTAEEINYTIVKMTFSSKHTSDAGNYRTEVYSILDYACENDLDFDAFIQLVYNCDAISNKSTTFEAARDYLLRRGLI